jgi:hypothetical protein
MMCYSWTYINFIIEQTFLGYSLYGPHIMALEKLLGKEEKAPFGGRVLLSY